MKAYTLVETLGFYVHPDTTVKLILPALAPNSAAVSFKLGCLRTLQSVLKGSTEEKLINYVSEIVHVLSERDLLQNENMHVLVEVSKCVKVVIEKAKFDVESSFTLFFILVNLQSATGTEKILGYTELMQTVLLPKFRLKPACRKWLLNCQSPKINCISCIWTRLSPSLRPVQLYGPNILMSLKCWKYAF
jgi:hypothetical protein